MIDAGELGEIYHFRASYQQEWIMDADFPQVWRLKGETSGSGALGDLGAHIIDIAHYLVGGVKMVQGLTTTFIKERPTPEGGMEPVDVDDAFAAIIEFENGAIGTLEATRFAAGHKNSNIFEINAEKGSIRFDMERLNELEVYWVDDEPRETRGFHTVNVTEAYHPWMSNWWPHGHIIGWEHTFVHEIAHFLDCIVHDKPVAPLGATFEDGYRAAVVCDAILRSSQTKRAVDIRY
jgi:predicted dehydrogenase